MVLWSLEVEVQFYLLAPWLAKIFAIRRAWLRRACLAGAIYAAPWLAYPLNGSYLGWASVAGNLQYFLPGFLIADLYMTGELCPNSWARIWDLLFLAAGVLVFMIKYQMASNALLPWVLLLSGLAAFLGWATPAILGNPWIATIGGMCYTIYLYHALLISAIYRATSSLHTKIIWLDLLVQVLVTVPVVLLVSSVLFRLFERPFMRADWPARAAAFFFRKPGSKP
jgi:peptidoglycan/LPS O-acetylase OafA/YrhL